VGEVGIFASLQENPTQIARVMRGFGWDQDERVRLFYRSPVDVYIDEWVHELLDLIEETGARRVLIDSLSDLRIAAPDAIRFHEYVYSLAQRFSRLGVTMLMTHEIHQLFNPQAVIESAISHLADNLMLLRYVANERDIERALITLKTRASQHDPRIQPFWIGDEGISFRPA
jgi:circadian clock protein KaiC